MRIRIGRRSLDWIEVIGMNEKNNAKLSKIILKTWDWFSNKGIFFGLNIIILVSVTWLINPTRLLFLPFETFSSRYLVFISLYIVLAVIFVWLIFKKDKRFNRDLFIIIIFSFLLVECFLWVLSLCFLQTSSPYQAEVYRFPKPYVMFTGKPNAVQGSLTLNELGFRGELPSKDKGDEIRIIMLGGSTVFSGTPLSKSIAGQLELLFHLEGYNNVKVYNWGVVSSVSGQELTLLLHTVSEYDPDLVIVYDGGNDAFQPYTYDPRPGYPYNFLVYEAGFKRITRRAPASQHLASLLLKSGTLGLLSHLSGQSLLEDKAISMTPLRKSVGYKSESWEEQISSTYISNIEKMCVLANGFDFKLAVFLQPMVHFKQPLVGKEERLLGDSEFQEYIKRIYEQMRIGINDLALKYNEDNRYLFVDISYAFSDYNRETYTDLIHIHDEDKEFIAAQMYKHLKQIVEQMENEK